MGGNDHAPRSRVAAMNFRAGRWGGFLEGRKKFDVTGSHVVTGLTNDSPLNAAFCHRAVTLSEAYAKRRTFARPVRFR